jgi:hypothetical protein
MAAQTGRTTFKNLDFRISDSGNGTIRSIPINSLSVVGLVYDEQDLTAWQDAVKGSLPTMPDAPIDFGGPFDTTAAAAAGTLSGSHTVLSPLVGAMTPLMLDIQFGVRHAWEAGEPQFGITASATSGYIVTKYQVDPSTMSYSARAVLFPGSALPAWGTAAEATA